MPDSIFPIPVAFDQNLWKLMPDSSSPTTITFGQPLWAILRMPRTKVLNWYSPIDLIFIYVLEASVWWL